MSHPLARAIRQYYENLLPDPTVDSHWITLPPPNKRDARQRFIAAAAYMFKLTRSTGAGSHRQWGVEKQFYQALLTCPLPGAAQHSWKYQPTREDIYVHLVTWRLHGQTLPYPVVHFAPENISS